MLGLETLKQFLIKKAIHDYLGEKVADYLRDLPPEESAVAAAAVVRACKKIEKILPSAAPFLDSFIDAVDDIPLADIPQGGVVDKTLDSFEECLDWINGLVKGKTSAAIAMANTSELRRS